MTTGEWFLGGTTIFLGLIAVAAIVINVWINKNFIQENRRVETGKKDLEIKARALEDIKTWACEVAQFTIFLAAAYGSEAREAAAQVVHLVNESSILDVLTTMFDNKRLKNLFKDLTLAVMELKNAMISQTPTRDKKMLAGEKEKFEKIVHQVSISVPRLLREISEEKVKLYKREAAKLKTKDSS